MGSTTKKLMRIHALGRKIYTTDEVNYKFGNIEDGAVINPQLSKLLKIPILVSTLQNAAIFRSSGTPPGHFKLIMIDEAAQVILVIFDNNSNRAIIVQ